MGSGGICEPGAGLSLGGADGSGVGARAGEGEPQAGTSQGSPEPKKDLCVSYHMPMGEVRRAMVGACRWRG